MSTGIPASPLAKPMLSRRAVDKLALHAQRATLLEAMALDKYRRHPERLGLPKQGLPYALLSSTPIVLSLRVLWVRSAVTIAFTVFALVWAVRSSDIFSRGTIPPHKYYRFTNLEHRNGSLGAPSTPGIAEFGFLRRGEMRGRGVSSQGEAALCMASDGRGGFSVEGAAMTLALGETPGEAFDAWFLVTPRGNGTEGMDAVRFKLEGSDDPSFAEPNLVGSSSHAHHHTELVLLSGTASYVPLERGARRTHDAKLPLWSAFLHFIVWGALHVQNGATAALAHSGRAHLCRQSVCATLGVGCALQLVAGLVYLAAELEAGGQPWEPPSHSAHAHSPFHLVVAAAFALALFVIVAAEEALEWVFLILGAGLLASSAHLRVALTGAGGSLPALDTTAAAGLLCLAVGVLILGWRAWLVSLGGRGILPGKARYDEVWRRVAEEQGEALASLQKAVGEMVKATEGKKPVQLNRTSVPRKLSFVHGKDSQVESVHQPDYLEHNILQSARLAASLRVCRRDEAMVWGGPVNSLDQLHTQAFLVHDTFLDLVVFLGKHYGGKFKLKGSAECAGSEPQPEFAAWDGSKESQGRYALGGVKSVASCVAKLDTAYSHNVSMLLDLVRETLYFDTATDLEACLRAIQDDPELEVVQVKSSMGDLDASELWAGMRFVKVSMMLVGSRDARWLHVETHVCELVLTLTDCARVQTRDMREAYRMWRQCKRARCAPQRLAKYCFGKGPEPLGTAAAGAGQSSPMWGATTPPTSTTRVLPLPPERPESEPASEVGAHFVRHHSSCDSVGTERMMMPRLSSCSGSSAGTGTGRKIKRHSSFDSTILVDAGGEVGSKPAVETSWGVELSGEMVELLYGLAHISALGFSNFIDLQWDLILDKSGVESSDFASVFYSAHPLTAASRRWQLQLMMLACGVYYGLEGIAAIDARHIMTKPYGPFKHFRLETMLTRDGSNGREIAGPGVSDFNLLGRSRCTRASLPSERSDGAESTPPTFSGPIGTSFMVSYPEGRSMTGWYLKSGAAEGSQPHDPAYFNVWATNGDVVVGDGSCALGREEGMWWEGGDESSWCGAKWTRVGSPTWSFKVAPAWFRLTTLSPKVPWSFLQLPVDLPKERGLLQTYILHIEALTYDAFFVLSPLFVSAAATMCSLAGAITSHFPKFPGAHLWLAILIGMGCFCEFFSAAIAFSTGRNHLGAEFLVFGVNLLIFTMMGLAQGPWLVRTVLIGWVINLSDWAAISMWLFQTPHVSFSGIVMLLLWAAVFILRKQSLWSSWRLLKNDQASYDTLFAALMEEGKDSRLQIEQLEKAVSMISTDDRGNPHQRNRLRVDTLPPDLSAQYATDSESHLPHNPLFLELGRRYIPGRLDPKSDVASVNQLCAGAAVANLLLLERVKVWAEETGGMFRLRKGASESMDGQGFVKWSDAKDDAVMREQIQWSSMKRHGRMFQKLARSYAHKPYKLLDIGRHSIVFDDIAGLVGCLGKISTDSNVCIERVKNRLSPSYNSDETAGYRDVCINLRVVHKQAETVGADIHTCEVQLILREFAVLKTADGHRRYVIARNSRGT